MILLSADLFQGWESRFCSTLTKRGQVGRLAGGQQELGDFGGNEAGDAGYEVGGRERAFPFLPRIPKLRGFDSARTPPGQSEGQGRRRSSAGPLIGDQRQSRTICNAPERMLQRARDATAKDHQGTHRRAGRRPGSLCCLDTLGTKVDSLRLAGRSLSEMKTIIAIFAKSVNSLCPWCGLNGACRASRFSATNHTNLH